MVTQKEVTMIVTATFPATLPANQKVAANMQLDPALGTVTQQQVPVKESWVIDDVYVTASQGPPDAILDIKKNLVESLLRTSPINSLLVSNPSRPKFQPKLLSGADILTIEAQNLTTVGASAVTDTCYMKVIRFIE